MTREVIKNQPKLVDESKMASWRNGIRVGFKNQWSQGRESSSLSEATTYKLALAERFENDQLFLYVVCFSSPHVCEEPKF